MPQVVPVEKDRTAAAAMNWAVKYRVETVTVAASIEHWDLGLGDSQVIAHYVDGSRAAVLNDRAARYCAMAHNVPLIGTPGVVLRSKKNRQIESARPLVQELIAAGMFLDDRTV